jgi:hypothetical protein
MAIHNVRNDSTDRELRHELSCVSQPPLSRRRCMFAVAAIGWSPRLTSPPPLRSFSGAHRRVQPSELVSMPLLRASILPKEHRIICSPLCGQGFAKSGLQHDTTDNAQCSMLNAQCSMLNAQCTMRLATCDLRLLPLRRSVERHAQPSRNAVVAALNYRPMQNFT